MTTGTACRVKDGLGEELARFGGATLDSCFNCGNCTAVCGLSDGEHAFPRRVIRYLQLGLEARLLESTDPWLCYYCGQCSETCPRQAEPGEHLMATRRWLTSRYAAKTNWTYMLLMTALTGLVTLIFQQNDPAVRDPRGTHLSADRRRMAGPGFRLQPASAGSRRMSR